MADYGILDLGKISRLIRDKDALALRHVRWLTDPVLVWLVFHL